jgi:purine-binding chemotaxis protein CheW
MEKVLTFYLCDSLFGIDIKKVKEIDRRVEYTPVPGSNPFVAGLYNMRGQIVTLFDLARILGHDSQAGQGQLGCIILKPMASHPDQFGFLIDAPGDVIEITNEISELPPANVGHIAGELLEKVVKLPEQLLLVLQSEKIINSIA